ncbi:MULTISPECIES: hypothetical protein [Chromobacterium]|uniref:Uncharacterized protein n=2 Tax=Chromobacterium TaxID=535 RepID=Q7NV08_CHRVO|nr:hypothetical protein [Chromobacterium violaceum]AAQ60209.1 hypothetical protein CV_2538 [Chromobacterium violaceum ATCC 12472]
MNVKDAVSSAKRYIIDLLADENLSNVGLEEVELDQSTNQWIVTIGFSRPWDEPRNALAALAGSNGPRRSYKVVRIDNQNDQVLSVKNREAPF